MVGSSVKNISWLKVYLKLFVDDFVSYMEKKFQKIWIQDLYKGINIMRFCLYDIYDKIKWLSILFICFYDIIKL